MARSVAQLVLKGDERRTLDGLAEALVEAIGKVDDAQVPPLAARLVDVLKRIGGEDPSTLIWLRDGLATAVDRLVDVQGERSEQGRPLGTELPSMVRQLLATLDAIAAHEGGMVDEGNPLDELAAARARRLADRLPGAAGLQHP